MNAQGMFKRIQSVSRSNLLHVLICPLTLGHTVLKPPKNLEKLTLSLSPPERDKLQKLRQAVIDLGLHSKLESFMKAL